jgi:SagB-type dehydrogenase family enzyme
MKILCIGFLVCLMAQGWVYGRDDDKPEGSADQGIDRIRLPDPATGGGISVEEAIQRRRSVRRYSVESLTLKNVGQLVWAAQGITGERGLRAAPSAGATYPLEVYVVAGAVDGLKPGVYRYDPAGHALILKKTGDVRNELASAALGQSPVKNAPVSLVLSGIVQRTAGRYGERAQRYVQIEIGHAAENVFLQAVGLNLGSVMVGAFQDAEVKKLIGMEGGEEPYAIIPVGR